MANFKNVFLPSGYKLPRYTIEKRLSSGGFGAIYVAKHENGNTVALKEFLPSVLNCRNEENKGLVFCKDTESQKKFEKGLAIFFKEADTVAKIRDDRVVAILDVFEANGTAYFAMPLEQGETLQRLIKRKKEKLPDSTLQQIFIDAATGIQVLHDHGLLHLDIKPGNLWIRPDGSLVVLDLGASREQDNYQLFGPPARTPGYAAPEQHQSYKTTKLTVQTDVYGLAASLYCCLEGKAPLVAPERTKEDMSYVKKRMGQHSLPLLKLVEEGLEIDPKNRIKTAEEFKERLFYIPRIRDNNKKKEIIGKSPALKI